MPNKLKFYISEKGEKIYTLKSEIESIPTQDAHYTFLKFIEVVESKSQQ